MALSNELISQFVKATKDDTKAKKSETTVNGTVTEIVDGKVYVRIDGSDHMLPATPVSTTADVTAGERVIVSIKDHTATVVGNVTSPSGKAAEIKANSSKISEFDIVVAHDVVADEITAIRVYVDNLIAELGKFENIEAVSMMVEEFKGKYAEIKRLTATDIKAMHAELETIRTTFLDAVDISAENIDAVTAEIDNLKAYTADFTYISALKANVEDLNAKKLDATWANIDYANIDKTTMKEFYASSGLISEVVTDDATVTGYLIGVKIRGDLIEAGTLQADRLIIKDYETGLYYQLNFAAGEFKDGEQVPTDKLHGSVIVAKSVTANKISVSDLVAFGATIGGFHITDKSIYSGVKESVDNPIAGFYVDNEGQLSLGDETNFLRYYKVYILTDESIETVNGDPVDDLVTTTGEQVYLYVDSDGIETYYTIIDSVYKKIDVAYKLDISADSILFGGGSKRSVADIQALTEHVKIGTHTDEETGETVPSIELAEGDSEFKQVITNKEAVYMYGSKVRTKINNEGVVSDNVTANREFRQGQWVWATRSNGNYGLMWKG